MKSDLCFGSSIWQQKNITRTLKKNKLKLTTKNEILYSNRQIHTTIKYHKQKFP